MGRTQAKIPLLIKWIFVLFLLFLITFYWAYYGPSNFLWYSDIFLFIAFFATLFESKFLASMAASGGLLPTFLWSLSLLVTMVAKMLGFSLFELPGYMFDEGIPIGIRSVSLFHIALFPYFIWLIHRLGYHKTAWGIQVLLIWALAFTTWLVTNEAQNINFVYSYKALSLEPIPYLVLECLVASLCVFATHCIIKKMC